jgi:hypothetical protein
VTVSRTADVLEGLTEAELCERAGKLGIADRSTMDRRQLIEALSGARRRGGRGAAA